MEQRRNINVSQTKHFRDRLRAAFSKLTYEAFCERAGFREDDYSNRMWRAWLELNKNFAAFDDVTLEGILGSASLIPIYVVLDGTPPDLKFLEVEQEDENSTMIDPPIGQYPGHTTLWRLGPFLAFSQKSGSEAVPSVSGPGSQSARKDGASGGGTPGLLAGYERVDTSNGTHLPNEGEEHPIEECEARGCVKLRLEPLTSEPKEGKSHQLLMVGIEEEADAKCTCGGWRLLRMSTTRIEITAIRQREIQNAFRHHLEDVGAYPSVHQTGAQ